MDIEEKKGTVCVTGGTGFIGSWLVMRLLHRGYSVRATIRSDSGSAGKKKDTSYLTELPGAKERLEIFKADLKKPESFETAIEGCIGVFHVAHPVDSNGEKDKEEVTKTAVEGLLGILRASLNSETVKRVVYTSTLASVLYNNNEEEEEGLSVITDENTWSDLEICRRNKSITISSSYLVSKTVTEKLALDFAAKHGLELVSLVLPLVVGPFICPLIPSSVHLALAPLFGNEEMYKDINNFYMVHIDDATNAHIFLFEHPNAKGRYIFSPLQISTQALVKYFSTNQALDTNQLNEIEDLRKSNLSSMKLFDLGFKFEFGLEEMIDESVQCCKDKGFL